jgi:hypothetical protein
MWTLLQKSRRGSSFCALRHTQPAAELDAENVGEAGMPK